MWCRHREFKHDVRERRLPSHSLMNIAASTFCPVPSHRAVEIPLTCHQQFAYKLNSQILADLENRMET